MKYFLKTQWMWLLCFLILSLATITLLLVKTNYEVVTPAMITSVDDYITIEGKEDVDIDINSVSVYGFSKVSVLNYIISVLNPFSNEELLPSYINSSQDYSVKQGTIHRQKSIDNAIISAYKAAGYEVNIYFDGYTVTTIYTLVTADIELGDKIIKVNDEELSLDYSFQQAWSKAYYAGAKSVTCTLKRIVDGKYENKTIELEIMNLDQSITIGVGADCDFSFKVADENAPTFKYNHGESIGPSGGLMQALYIYDKLNDGKLTKGLKIAGTGAINHNGDALLISGTEQKIYISNACGADIFFVPIDMTRTKEESQYLNYNEAKKAEEFLKSIGQTKMKIVPVKNLQEAIEYLEGLQK